MPWEAIVEELKAPRRRGVATAEVCLKRIGCNDGAEVISLHGVHAAGRSSTYNRSRSSSAHQQHEALCHCDNISALPEDVMCVREEDVLVRGEEFSYDDDFVARGDHVEAMEISK